MRVTGVGFRPGGGAPFAIPGHRHRIDRQHLVAGLNQGTDPRAAVCLDPDLHPGGRRCLRQVHRLVRQMLNDPRVPPRDPLDTFGQSRFREPPSLLVDQLDVMVVFCPVIPDEQHPPLLSQVRTGRDSERSSQRTNGQVLTHVGGHVIPAAVRVPPDQRGHDLTLGLGRPVFTSAHPPAAIDPTLSDRRPGEPH